MTGVYNNGDNWKKFIPPGLGLAGSFKRGGYYVAVTLYQMWPVTVEGKPSTLVWRGDMISAPSLADLHGVERLGSESVMMKQISKAVTLFRRDTSGSR